LEEALQGLLSEQAFRSRATELHELVEEFVVGSEGETSVYSNLSSKAAFNDSLSGDTGLFSFMEKRRELVSAAIEAER
jgi:hypothetical protein